MIAKVKDFIIKHRLILAGDRVLAACSGGPDSLALLDMLVRLRDEIGFQLAAAHVDHMFRGEASAADARFVKEFCLRHGLACFSTAINVPDYLRDYGGSSQNVSRQLRYAYLAETAQAWGNAKIATGHHRDDQAETILLHLLRGSGGAGLGGMRPQSGKLIRPLLALNRSEIDAYCRQWQLQPRQDASNLTPAYLRNKFRLQLIPQLEAAIGGKVREPLCRTGQLIADEQDCLRQAVKALWPQLIRETEEATLVCISSLSKLHIALKRLLFRQVIEKKRGSLTGISFRHVETLIEMADTWQVGSRSDLPGGWQAERGYDTIRISRRGRAVQVAGIAAPGVRLLLPGETEIAPLGIRVRASLQSQPPASAAAAAVFDAGELKPPLFVRSRQPGDRFLPAGMPGAKKVKKFLIDQKIPRSLREQVPLFCDSRGVIFWLGGLRTARQGRITDATTTYLVLEIIQIQEALL